jgi:hypothetical protein
MLVRPLSVEPAAVVEPVLVRPEPRVPLGQELALVEEEEPAEARLQEPQQVQAQVRLTQPVVEAEVVAANVLR